MAETKSNATSMQDGDIEKAQDQSPPSPDDTPVAEEKPATANAADTIPNGGLRAWLVDVGAFFLLFNSCEPTFTPCWIHGAARLIYMQLAL